MPQIYTGEIRSNPFVKESRFTFDRFFQMYIQKNLESTDNYIVLEPAYSNLELSKEQFDPLEFFSKRILRYLEQNKLRIIFDGSGECSHINFPYFKRFLASFEQRKFDFSKFYYLTADGIEKHVYSTYKNIYHTNTLDSFFDSTVITKSDSKIDHLFSCLNRKPRYWRSKLTYHIQQNEYLKSKALCSHPKITDKSQFSDHDGIYVEQDLIDFFLNIDELQASSISPLKENMQFDQLISHLPEVYSRVAFDVCMECYQEGNHICYSEKLIKPILNSIPVLVWGTPGANTWQMTDIGFKTYDDWFDLSFDLETDTEKRLHLLLDEISRTCSTLSNLTQHELIQWQNKNPDVIEHNKQLVIDKLPGNKAEFSRLFNDLST